jgi:hypothetical protein
MALFNGAEITLEKQSTGGLKAAAGISGENSRIGNGGLYFSPASGFYVVRYNRADILSRGRDAERRISGEADEGYSFTHRIGTGKL